MRNFWGLELTGEFVITVLKITKICQAKGFVWMYLRGFCTSWSYYRLNLICPKFCRWNFFELLLPTVQERWLVWSWDRKVMHFKDKARPGMLLVFWVFFFFFLNPSIWSTDYVDSTILLSVTTLSLSSFPICEPFPCSYVMSTVSVSLFISFCKNSRFMFFW